MKQIYSKPELELLPIVVDGLLCQSNDDYTIDPLNPREDWPNLF